MIDSTKFKTNFVIQSCFVVVGIFSVSLVHKLLDGSADSRELLDKIFLIIPSFSLRKPSVFKINFHSANYGHAAPLDRALRNLK